MCSSDLSATWYGIGDEIAVDGLARYTSGAPVANAPVEVRIRRSEGRWPAPLEWEEQIGRASCRERV